MNIAIEKTLNSDNIDLMIIMYKDSINEMDYSVSANNTIEFFQKIKRESIKKGPYPNVTLFEAANRIMSDLVILFGIKKLLKGEYEDLAFDEYQVEYGNDNNNQYDIIAKNKKYKLFGEAFNVAPSFFQGKKSSSLKKLRREKSNNTVLLLLYNSDAVDINYTPKKVLNEYHIPVDINTGIFMQYQRGKATAQTPHVLNEWS